MMGSTGIKFFLALLAIGGSLTTGLVEAAPSIRANNYDNAGVQLKQNREVMERARVSRQIAKDQARKQEKVEEQKEGESQQQQGQLHFILQQVRINPSQVIAEEELAGITAPCIGKPLTLADLYRMVEEINNLYSKRGYLTCRAILPPQTIKQGTVEIRLIEGRTGQVKLMGNESTAEDYIRARLSLEQGRISNVNRLNEELLLFNGTNDVQLSLSMEAGEEVGETDFVLKLKEPPQHSWNYYTDNMGSKSSGEWRGGLFYTDRSLTGRRDLLSLTTMASDGSASLGMNYSNQLNTAGTKLNFGYSYNDVEIKHGELRELDFTSDAYALNLGLSHPLNLTEDRRTELTLMYNNQGSKSHIAGAPYLDDHLQDGQLGYAVTDYGQGTAFYRRYSLSYGGSKNIYGKHKEFTLGQFNAFYQKAFPHGQMWTARLDGQLSGNEGLPSSRQFYIGGAYSVRGYDESVLGGDHGCLFSVEYSTPLFRNNFAAFTFWDYGAVYGATALNDHILSSVGLGLRGNIHKSVYASLTWGVPLARNLNGARADSSKLHLLLNGSF